MSDDIGNKLRVMLMNLRFTLTFRAIGLSIFPIVGKSETGTEESPFQVSVRISLRKQPVLRDRVFGVVLAAALLHGGYLVSNLYDQESK